jgi:chemosensory pili system protein ChpA (sensor histidine kinase/response regulator)
MARLAAHERLPRPEETEDADPAAAIDLDLALGPALACRRLGRASERSRHGDEDIDAVDLVDVELFPIFAEEALELLPQLQGRLRDWIGSPADAGAPAACMRTLHTFKGGARLAGAMRLGEMAHRLETAVEHLAVRESVQVADIEPLLARADAMEAAFLALQQADVPLSTPAPTPAQQQPQAAAPPASLPTVQVPDLSDALAVAANDEALPTLTSTGRRARSTAGR